MEEKAAFFLRSGWLTGDQMDIVQAKTSEYCLAARKMAIPIIDSFCLTDHIINSPLGVASGDVYREYMGTVRRHNPQNREHPYFEKVIKPFLFREESEMEDFDEAIVSIGIRKSGGIERPIEISSEPRLSPEFVLLILHFLPFCSLLL